MANTLRSFLERPRHSALGMPAVITRTNFRHLYSSIYQQVAHHAVTGCNLRPPALWHRQRPHA